MKRRYIRHTGGIIEDTEFKGEVKLGPDGFRPVEVFGSELEAVDYVKACEGKLREGALLAITQAPSGRYFVFPVRETAKGDLVTITTEEAGFLKQ